MEVLIIFIALTILGILGIAAQFFGHDSRDGFTARPRPEPWYFPRQDS